MSAAGFIRLGRLMVEFGRRSAIVIPPGSDVQFFVKQFLAKRKVFDQHGPYFAQIWRQTLDTFSSIARASYARAFSE